VKNKILAAAILLLFFLNSCKKPGVELKDGDNYGVEAIKLKLVDYTEAVLVYDKLKKKGHLVYYESSGEAPRIYISVIAGCYAEEKKAKKDLKDIKRITGLKGSVVKTDLEIKGKTIKTPSGTWEISGREFKEKEYYPNPEMEMYQNRFEGTSSADGRYNAWIKHKYDEEWESPSSLWISEYGKTERIELIKTENNMKPKSFKWHPEEYIIFYVYGYMFGTVSQGGDIYAADMEGNTKIAVGVSPESRMEIRKDFMIEDNKIYYSLVKFDENYLEYTITPKSVLLDEIPYVHGMKN